MSHDGAENPTATRDGWIVYASGNPAKLGVWKVRQDGSEAARLCNGPASVTEVSPNGKYAAYRNRLINALVFIQVVDGAAVPFQAQDAAFRCRWVTQGRSIAFLSPDEKGVFAQDFALGHDTTRTRRKLVGSDIDLPLDSFGISPDGARMTISRGPRKTVPRI